jgi:hypothetical protein
MSRVIRAIRNLGIKTYSTNCLLIACLWQTTNSTKTNEQNTKCMGIECTQQVEFTGIFILR